MVTIVYRGSPPRVALLEDLSRRFSAPPPTRNYVSFVVEFAVSLFYVSARTQTVVKSFLCPSRNFVLSVFLVATGPCYVPFRSTMVAFPYPRHGVATSTIAPHRPGKEFCSLVGHDFPLPRGFESMCIVDAPGGTHDVPGLSGGMLGS